jgi:hypothetical protein
VGAICCVLLSQKQIFNFGEGIDNYHQLQCFRDIVTEVDTHKTSPLEEMAELCT